MAEEKKLKGPKKMERHFKGVASHRRIQILQLVAKEEDITLEKISESTKCNFKNASVHTQKLMLAGLIEKQYRGREVMHKLTPYGRMFVAFINDFSRA